MRANWVTWVVLVVVSAALGAFIARWIGGGGPPPPPPPGDVIIVRPRPSNSTATSTYWLIGGDDPIPVEEAGNTRLNTNAFPYVSDFSARVDVNQTRVKVFPGQLKVHFKHCKNTTVNQCDADADCGGSDTCMTSELILKRVTNNNTKDKFEWWVDGVLQQAYDYQNSRKWRGELCGRLTGDVGVSFTYNSSQYSDVPVPTNEEVDITADTTP